MAESKIRKRHFGQTSDTKEPVHLYTLTNALSTQIELIEFGAGIRSWRVPIADGGQRRLMDIALGYETLEGYEKSKAYIGCVVGRVCNHIKAGQFEIDGQTYRLAVNSGPNHLHGGEKGFSYRLWKVTNLSTDSITFERVSEDNEEGYPSHVRIAVTYRLASDANRLSIEYDAVNEGDKTTPVNLTNHAYFNLNGVENRLSTIFDHELQVFSDTYLPADENDLVTGEVLPVEGTPYDFRSPWAIGERMSQLLPKPGYNVHYPSSVTDTPKVVAKVSCPTSGLTLTVSTTQPGVLLYVGQYLNEKGAKYGQSYGQYTGMCLEAQHYPDAVNQPHFPSVWLRPGERYHHVTVYEVNAS